MQVAVVGLVLQFISFLTFVCLAVVFGLRVWVSPPTPKYLGIADQLSKRRTPWKWSKTITRQTSQGSSTIYLRWNEDWRVLYWAVMYTAVGFIVSLRHALEQVIRG
jgi:hypothetical protein